jgi:hypothetical protein
VGEPSRNSAQPDFPTEGELWDVDRLERHARKLADQSGEFADTVLAQVQSQWDNLLGAVQIRTPDRGRRCAALVASAQ